jgi:hypothetical protein
VVPPLLNNRQLGLGVNKIPAFTTEQGINIISTVIIEMHNIEIRRSESRTCASTWHSATNTEIAHNLCNNATFQFLNQKINQYDVHPGLHVAFHKKKSNQIIY